MEDLTLFVPTNNSFKLVVSEEKCLMFQPIRKRNFPMWPCYLQDQEK